MRNDTVVRFRKKDEVLDPLTELLREGAQQLITQAVSTELELFSAHHRERRDAEARRAVVRNGYLPAREVLTGIGPGAVCRFASRQSRAAAARYPDRRRRSVGSHDVPGGAGR
jgi:hypothetical protein